MAAEQSILLGFVNEVMFQRALAREHFRLLKENLAAVTPDLFVRDNQAWAQRKRNVFSSAQSALTCASIVDTILTGRGPPPPRGRLPVPDSARAELRSVLKVPPGFSIRGRDQRNSLIHIDERIVQWAQSRPPNTGMEDQSVIDFSERTPQQLLEVPRAIDRETLEFSVFGEKCSLTEVEEDLKNAAAHVRRVA